MVVRLEAVPSPEDRAKLCQAHRFLCLRACMPLSILRTDMNLLNKSCASTLHFAKFLITLWRNLNFLASTVSCLTTPGYLLAVLSALQNRFWGAAAKYARNSSFQSLCQDTAWTEDFGWDFWTQVGYHLTSEFSCAFADGSCPRGLINSCIEDHWRSIFLLESRSGESCPDSGVI